MTRLDNFEEKQEQRCFGGLFRDVFVILLTLSPLLLVGFWERWGSSLPPEPSPLWEQWMQFWWLLPVSFCLMVLNGVAANYLLRLHSPYQLHRSHRYTRSLWQSAEKHLKSHLREGEQVLGIARVTLPAPFHPIHSQTFEAVPEIPLYFAFIYGSLTTVVFGVTCKILDVPLSREFQLTVLTFWAFASLSSLLLERGVTTLFGIHLFSILSGTFLLCMKVLSPNFQTAMMVIVAFNITLLLIRSLALLRFPITGLLVITTERVILLGRISRRWLVLRLIERNLPVRIFVTFRAVDALMRWQTGIETFAISVDLIAASEFKNFVSEHFPHWRWEGDSTVPKFTKRLQRDGLWRLALLLILASWSGWVWYQSSLRMQMFLKFFAFSVQNESDSAGLHMNLKRTEFMVKLLPNEPLAHAFLADTLFIIGEWEKAKREMQILPQSGWWIGKRRLMDIEKQWRGEVERKFGEGNWRFDLAMAERLIAWMVKRGRVSDLFVQRTIVWLKRSLKKGAPKEVSGAVETLELAAEKKDLNTLQKAQKQFQRILRR